MQHDEMDKIQELAKQLIQPVAEKGNVEFQEKMAVLLERPRAKTFLIQMLDVAFRSKTHSLTASYVHWLFQSNSSYRYLFSHSETALLRLFQVFGRHVPAVSVPVMLGQIQDMTQSVVFFEGEPHFKKHAAKRAQEGSTLNINLIGEALIGESSAQDRMEHYKNLLRQDEIEYVSIKMSTIFSQIRPLAFDSNIKELVQRLSSMYRELQAIQKDTGRDKFLNIDMEEYRDLWLNIEVFTQTLDQEEFKNLRAGIVLQAYLPDSYKALQHLKKWAKKRVENGGTPIKIRLVKGANLEMELTEASHRGWPNVTYNSKKETDANYKRILNEVLEPECSRYIHLGVASHNIFDISYALLRVKEYDLFKEVQFEILEGMAPELSYHLRSMGAKLVIYTPLVVRSDYNAAIAYLVRRLDEGTQKGNFLKEGFKLQHPSTEWDLIWDQFTHSIDLMEEVSQEPQRDQDRNTPYPDTYFVNRLIPHFDNEADTDWTLPANRSWMTQHMNQWQAGQWPFPQIIPITQLPNSPTTQKLKALEYHQGTTPWQYELAEKEHIEDFINCSSAWSITAFHERFEILRIAAQNMRERRSDLIGAALLELGKQVDESDVEVSEAIDFANYYAESILHIEDLKVQYETQGINLILSPWNFPIAIPIGGVLASLAAGKRVILKPSLNASATAYVACQCLWDAGVPHNALGFLPADESAYQSFLEDQTPFDAVILTGSNNTAQALLKMNPNLPLYAETGGKNSTYIEALSDHEQAISDFIQSAYSNAGQKCSASSLLILQEELYHDKGFKHKLKDAIESLKVGNPWEFDTRVGYLSDPVNDRILKLLKDTPDEDWFIKPELEGNYLLSPGLLWKVKQGDYFYETEFFGPIAGVMKAKNVQEAVKLANGVSYGLTSGITSLNPPSVDYWKENIQAGNLYVNRSTTGAIVQRQPFGGMKESCFGFGMKAGGPNYVLQFLNLMPYLEEDGQESTIDQVKVAYAEAYSKYYETPEDLSLLRGQHNIFRYLKTSKVLLMTDQQTDPLHTLMVQAACQILKIPVKVVSCPSAQELPDFLVEYSEYFSHNARIRSLAASIPQDLKIYCQQRAYHVYERPPHASGRVELLNYLEEQSLSINYHRYGNTLGIQPGEF